jgi:uncharacterized repeat protein (TIGR01451 family)
MSRRSFRMLQRPVAVLAVLATVATSCVLALGPAPSAIAAGTPDITLTEKAPATVLYGSPATIALTAANPSGTYGYNLALRDVLPVGVAYLAGSTAPAELGEPTVLSDQPGAGQTTLVWPNVADLAPGADFTLTFAVQGAVEPAATVRLPGSSYTDSAAAYANSDPRLTAKVSATGAISSFTGSATAAGSSTVTAIAISKDENSAEHELPRGVHDDKATYSLIATNLGPSDADGPVTVSDTLPAVLTFLGATGTWWTCTGAPGVALVTCTLPAGLPAGSAGAPIEVVALIGAALPAGPPVVNSATVHSPTPDPVDANNTALDPATVSTSADLSIVKSHSAALRAGGLVDYQLVVRNLGPSDASGPITVTDEQPAGLTYTAANGPTDSGWACSVQVNTVSCVLAGGLPSKASAAPITVTAAIGTPAYPSVTNTATVSGATSDPDDVNNSSSDAAPVLASSTLSINKTHAGPVLAGGVVNYTIQVMNHGLTEDPGPLTVVDELPFGLHYRSAAADCSAAGAIVTCMLPGPLAVGATVAFALTAVVDSSAGPSVTNVARVVSTADPVGGSASDPTAITPVAAIARPTTGDLATTGSPDAELLRLGLLLLATGILLIAAGRRGWSRRSG